MSDDFADVLGGVFNPGDLGGVSPVLSSVNPNWNTGGMYAPINYQPAPSAYSPINTNTTGKTGAQRLNAQVIRAQYQDYEQRFKPIEDLAVSLMTDSGTKDLPYDLARTRQTVGGVFGSVQGQQGRAMERFGQTNTARNITGSNAEAGTLVGGLNTATFADEERRMKLLGGGSSSASAVVRGGGES